MNTENVKHWFTSLANGNNTQEMVKGKTISEGVLNIVFSHAFISVFALYLVMPDISIQDLWPVGFLIVGIISWLTRTYLYHSFALILGGKGNYQEYTVKTSFPISGSMVIGTFLIGALLISGIEWIWVYLLMVFIPLLAIIQITEKEYALPRTKAIVAVLIPTLLMIVLSVAFSYYGVSIIP